MDAKVINFQLPKALKSVPSQKNTNPLSQKNTNPLKIILIDIARKSPKTLDPKKIATSY